MKSKIAITLTVLLAVVTAFGASHSDMGCDLCHTPHNAGVLPGVPLWNGTETTTVFTMYTSDTFDGTSDGVPTGTSKLCLGCHDGANAVWGPVMGASTIFGANELQNSHPISFLYDDALATLDGELKFPAEATGTGITVADTLDGDSKMQCTSCHDIHTTAVGEHFLREHYGTESIEQPDGSFISTHFGSELCRMCHKK